MLILLVEDNESIRYLYSRMLASRGFDVIEACDGEEALAFLGVLHPDLILTDLMMPRLDGIGLLRRVRVMPGLEAVPVVIISAADSDSLTHEARIAGASDVIAKPFDSDELFNRIMIYL